jgi:sec-independent protein translocase protein TatA
MKFLDSPGAIILLLAVILLFGAKKLPDVSRSVGRSLRIFKAETKGLMTDDEGQSVPPAVPPQIAVPPVPPPVVPAPAPTPAAEPVQPAEAEKTES